MMTRQWTDLRVDTNQNPNMSRTQVTFSDPPVTTIGIPNQDISMALRPSGILQLSVAGSRPHPKRSSLQQRLTLDLHGKVIPPDPFWFQKGDSGEHQDSKNRGGGNGRGNGGDVPGSGGGPPGRGPGGSQGGSPGGGSGRNPGDQGGSGGRGGGDGGNPGATNPSDPRSPELIHILHTVCRKDANDSLVLSLWHHKFHHHSELLTIDESIIQQLEYQINWDDNNQPVLAPLNLGGKFLIWIIQAAHAYLVQNVPMFTSWFDVTDFHGVIYLRCNLSNIGE